MPLNKGNLPSGWSRAGCRTCKRRKKKCDGTKPSCDTCQRLGVECEGYASAWTEPLTDHQHKGRRPRERSSESTVTWRGTSSSMLPRPHDEPVVLCPRPCFSTGPEADLFFLQYHDERIANALVHINSEENPLRCLLLPRAVASPVLRDVVCALSAMHFYRNVSRLPSAKANALRYYGNALSAIQPLMYGLDQNHGMPAGIEKLPAETLVLAVTWLCIYEVADGGIKHWRSHLNASQAMLARPDIRYLVDPQIVTFVSSICTYTQSVALLTARRGCASMGQSTHSFTTLASTGIDNYLGYTEEVMHLCVRISNLRMTSGGASPRPNELFDICRRLSHWHCDDTRVTSHKLPRGVSTESQARLKTVANLYYYSAVIYLHSVVAEASGTHNVDGAVNDPLLTIIPEAEALTRFCEILESTSIGHHCEYSALVFPLFIAACEAQQQDQQGLIFKALEKLRTTFGIENVSAAIEVVQRVHVSHGRRRWFEVLDDSDWDLVLA